DNRNFGASDGQPRQEIDPWAQVRDYRHAITYATTLPEVDDDRIGAWGSSYSGGHVLVVGAIDRRVKAVVAQVPLISGHDNFRALVRSDFIDGLRESFVADRLARYEGKDPVMVPVVDEDPLAPSALPTPDSYTWFTRTHELRAPSWRNEVTLRSIEMFTEYEPIAYIPYISPTPLLLLPAQNDVLTPTDLTIAAYEKAREPKKLQILPGGHFDAYVDGFDASGPAARDWFVQHLGAA
ncbi:MAG: acetylxylan esterase, partial [Pseudonocardia sp.]|nr:acetylxylan esterase [Pseudonocardia sp.]